MARISEVEVERLKREVSLLRLLEGQGHTLVRQGKDMACRCPWHAGDDTPSCVVTPASNLWHCFGCDAGGTVIDWTMRWHKVSFRHAVELLLKDHPALSAPADTRQVMPGKPGTPDSWHYARPAADFPVDPEDDQRVLDEVIGYYRPCCKAPRRWPT